MKVTVQNGAAHVLSRSDVEAIIPLFPAAWSDFVGQIVLYQNVTGEPTATYFPGQRLIGLHWPRPKEAASKEDGVRELLLAISVSVERGEFPPNLTKSMRRRHLEAVEELRALCMLVLAENAA